jgi:hypothetical protein
MACDASGLAGRPRFGVVRSTIYEDPARRQCAVPAAARMVPTCGAEAGSGLGQSPHRVATAGLRPAPAPRAPGCSRIPRPEGGRKSQRRSSTQVLFPSSGLWRASMPGIVSTKRVAGKFLSRHSMDHFDALPKSQIRLNLRPICWTDFYLYHSPPSPVALGLFLG